MKLAVLCVHTAVCVSSCELWASWLAVFLSCFAFGALSSFFRCWGAEMVQQDLLEWPGRAGPNVHKDARDTEIEAAEFVAPKVTGLRFKALTALRDAPAGLTGSQVAQKMGAWIYSVKPRLTELDRMRLVEDSQRREKNDRGRKEVVWQITAAGREFLETLDD